MRIRTVDAFTDRPFAGNPAAVVLLEDGPFPGDDRLQRLAAELNLSETAYAHPLPDDPGADWALRWFTPRTEVDMCGHATLATAHVLHADGRARGRVRFRARCGVLTAVTAPDGTVTLDFPTAPLSPVPVPEGLAAALGAKVLSAHDTGPHVGDLVAELPDAQTVRELAPDAAALERLPHRGVIVTARAGTDDADHDFVSRFFGPAVGIPEDPVTGSAHTALAPFWSPRLGRDTLTGRQLSARGGLVRTTLRGERTELAGRAVTMLDAELRAEF
ncbi:PhzF family phenazine biosynthesis protein [Streptomyces sp. JJ36]|uniref:PhzF family phenazine biosynthesis protein n=1 Tax=Streptomyces sp. JJ36 TaxID=2736645 RepID=UPI001F21AE44|nr:PhzF family phenazine biosynthesis protein [Streptomyces sp. JJ36]MCF6524329.1 PhzF family phenazine biosynthesis protein [Streptomyces sp. JJ36]